MDLGYLQGIEHESECRISVRMDGMNSEIWSGEIGFCKNGIGCSSMNKRFQKKGLCNWSQWGIPLSTFMRVCAALLPMLWTLRGVSKSFAWLASRQESGEEGLTCSQQIPANSLHFVAGRFAFSEALPEFPEFCLSIDSPADFQRLHPHGHADGPHVSRERVRTWQQLFSSSSRRGRACWTSSEEVTLVTLVTLHFRFEEYTEYHWVHVTWSSLQWMQLCVYKVYRYMYTFMYGYGGLYLYVEQILFCPCINWYILQVLKQPPSPVNESRNCRPLYITISDSNSLVLFSTHNCLSNLSIATEAGSLLKVLQLEHRPLRCFGTGFMIFMRAEAISRELKHCPRSTRYLLQLDGSRQEIREMERKVWTWFDM